MKFRTAFLSSVSLSVGVAMLGAITPATGNPTPNGAKFICGTSQGYPATVALTARGYVPVVRWSSNYFGRSGYSPQARCQMVSSKFQQYYANGMLNYLTPSYLNHQPVVCVAAAKGAPCAGVLFTLKPNSDPWLTLKQLLRVRTQAGPVLNESTASPLPVAEDRYLDVKEYLSTASVEVLTVPKNSSNLKSPATPAKGLW